MSHNEKIVAGLSGGVDSAVSALLLKKAGYDVIGVYMQNWEPENDDPHCTAEQDLTDARMVCDKLDIDFHVVNFAQEYWDRVFQYCLDEFAAYRTPNPDIWCNKEIKFNVFLDHAKTLGATKLATGHYVRTGKQGASHTLLKGLDPNKDQSYFLYTLNQAQLDFSIFPIGDIEKSHVRALAKEAGLINHNKKDSTGICFIGERKFKTFLQEFLLAQPGNIEATDGQIMGRHDGLMYYTRGQRKGLHIGGSDKHADAPWYVIDKDIKRNVLIIGQGHDNPLLYTQTLRCEQLHFVNNTPPSTQLICKAKTRYRQQEQPCVITPISEDRFEVTFDEPQRAVTPGQSVVFYQDDCCLGGGTITDI